MREDITGLIIGTANDLHEDQEIEIDGELGASTPLFGQSGLLDSLGLVSLVVAVEQAIEDEFDVRVSLADEKALSQTNSPYRTIGSLAEYAGSLVEEQRAGG